MKKAFLVIIMFVILLCSACSNVQIHPEPQPESQTQTPLSSVTGNIEELSEDRSTEESIEEIPETLVAEPEEIIDHLEEVPAPEEIIEPGPEPVSEPEQTTKPKEEPMMQPTAPETSPEIKVPSHEHSYSAEVIVSTCAAGGYTRNVCSCGDSYITEETTATNHSFSNWTITQAATFTSEGSQTQSCNLCGTMEIQAIPKETLDTAAIAAYGNSYATSLGFTLDASVASGNAGYYPALDYCVNTMSECYSYVAAQVYNTYSRLMNAHGTIEGARYYCTVQYLGSDAYGTYILISDYYG